MMCLGVYMASIFPLAKIVRHYNHYNPLFNHGWFSYNTSTTLITIHNRVLIIYHNTPLFWPILYNHHLMRSTTINYLTVGYLYNIDTYRYSLFLEKKLLSVIFSTTLSTTLIYTFLWVKKSYPISEKAHTPRRRWQLGRHDQRCGWWFLGRSSGRRWLERTSADAAVPGVSIPGGGSGIFVVN